MRGGGPRADSLDDLHYGVYYGIVTQNKDPEKLARVKVRFPWHAQGDTDQSAWAPVVTPMEGKKFGWYNVPEIEDVVAVMFIDGEFGRPIVLGGVWSTVDPSPEPNENGKNDFRGYASRSGHRLLLDDSDKVKVVLADKTSKNMLGIGEFDKAGAGPNACAVFKPRQAGTNGISISTMEGKFEMTAKEKLIITAKDIKIDVLTTTDIRADGDMLLEGGSAANVTSSADSSYDGPKMHIA